MTNEGRNFMPENKSSDQRTRKRARGRPRQINPRIVADSADHYRIAFAQFWPKLGPRLLAAKSPDELGRAVREDAAGISAGLEPHTELILKIVSDPKFPHTRSTSQVHFLADS